MNSVPSRGSLLANPTSLPMGFFSMLGAFGKVDNIFPVFDAGLRQRSRETRQFVQGRLSREEKSDLEEIF